MQNGHQNRRPTIQAEEGITDLAQLAALGAEPTVKPAPSLYLRGGGPPSRPAGHSDEALLPCPTVPLLALGDVTAVFRSSLGTGTNFDIAAADQSRPIATTLASAMDTRRICNSPLPALSIGD